MTVVPAQYAEEIDRIERVSDQMATIHATLRDGYGRRAVAADGVLLATSVAITTLALAGPDVLAFLSIRPMAARVGIAFLSAAVFLGLLLVSIVDWKRRSADHARASQVYASIKLKARDVRERDPSLCGILMPELLAQYALAGHTCPAVPDRAFAALKAAHARKVFLSRCLDSYPCVSIGFLRFWLGICHTWAALRAHAKSSLPEENE